MKKKGIECRPMIFPVSFADHFKLKYKYDEFLNSYKISLNSVHLPSSVCLKPNELKKICNCINNWDESII